MYLNVLHAEALGWCRRKKAENITNFVLANIHTFRFIRMNREIERQWPSIWYEKFDVVCNPFAWQAGTLRGSSLENLKLIWQ